MANCAMIALCFLLLLFSTIKATDVYAPSAAPAASEKLASVPAGAPSPRLLMQAMLS